MRHLANGLGAILVLAILLLPRVVASQTPNTEPFAIATKPSPENSAWAKWRAVEINIRQDLQVLHRCRISSSCPAPALRFLKIIDDARSRVSRDRIEAVNRAVNAAIRLMTDWQQWHEVDRWSAPLETFMTGFGDCEDFAIAKYVALGAAGVAADDLRLVIVQIHGQPLRDYHVVTAARDAGHWLLLDALRQDIFEDTEASNYTPRYELDYRGVREFTQPSIPVAGIACHAKSQG